MVLLVLFQKHTMSLIEGIGDEVTQFFLLLLTGVIAYIAWWSTSTSDQRQVRTVVLLDRRRPARSIVRIGIPSRYRRLTNYTETVTITAGNSSNNSTSVQTEPSNSAAVTAEGDSGNNTSSTVEPIKADTASTSTSGVQEIIENSESDDRSMPQQSPSHSQNPEERDIIETMDADTQNELRQRRLAHFETPASTSSDAATNIPSESAKPETSTKTDTNLTDKIQTEPQSNSEDQAGDNITIKLKYINDDIKVVDGRLEELLGDFKRRHFQEEMNANKEVKLIFNGHVLKQNQHSLQSCGLFHNCVVHCLIHQKRPSIGDRDRRRGSLGESAPQFFRNNNFPHILNVNNNNQGIEYDLGNFLYAGVCFILLAAWYFRYVYAHLYTVTATVGLIIITVIFSVVLVGAYLPNDDYDPPDTNLRIRVSRTERVEVQQQQ